MKLLKLILIILIFLHTSPTAFAGGRRGCVNTICSIGTDTIQAKHKRRKTQVLTPAEFRKMVNAHKHWFDDCVFTNKHSITWRLKQYPFSKAVKILAVSYPLQDVEADSSSYDPLKTGIHINDGILNDATIIEVKTLNNEQINKLTNIIFNTDYKRKTGINEEDHAACFDPRNSLLFYDSNGKIFDRLDICFECLGAESPTNRIAVGTICTQKFDMLKKFFIEAGINYGTTRK